MGRHFILNSTVPLLIAHEPAVRFSECELNQTALGNRPRHLVLGNCFIQNNTVQSCTAELTHVRDHFQSFSSSLHSLLLPACDHRTRMWRGERCCNLLAVKSLFKKMYFVQTLLLTNKEHFV